MKLICWSLDVEFSLSNEFQNLKSFCSFGCCLYSTVVVDIQAVSVSAKLSWWL